MVKQEKIPSNNLEKAIIASLVLEFVRECYPDVLDSIQDIAKKKYQLLDFTAKHRVLDQIKEIPQ